MLLLGWVLTLPGAFLSVWASVLVIRANAENRVAVVGPTPAAPRAMWTQVAGAILVIAGCALLAQSLGWAVLGFLAVTGLLSMGVRVAHNRRIADLGS